MAKTILIKNMHSTEQTYAGQMIEPGESYSILKEAVDAFSESSALFSDIASSMVVVNNGTNDLSPIDGWGWLVGDTVNAFITQKSDSQGNKVAVHASSKPMVSDRLFYAVWTSAGDDMSDGSISGGEVLAFEVETEDDEVTKTATFHPDNGQVYLHDGYVKWEDAPLGACICVTVAASPTPVSDVGAGNGDLSITDNWITYVGAGNGDHAWAGAPILIPRTFSRDGDWDYDGTLTPNTDGTGAYKISSTERDVHTFINQMALLGTATNYFEINSEESTLIPPGYFVKIILKNADSGVWKATVMMYIYREKTTDTS